MAKRDPSPLLTALTKRQVAASVVDFDHYRTGVAVETDYIISVQPTGDNWKEPPFAAFKISKTYKHFRELVSQFRKISDSATQSSKKWESMPKEIQNLVRLVGSVGRHIDSQRTQYLGKVNFTYVKSLARQRSQTINDTLDIILENYPIDVKGTSFLEEIANAINTFLLTDHVEEQEAPPTRSEGETNEGGLANLLTAVPSTKKLVEGIQQIFAPKLVVETKTVPSTTTEEDDVVGPLPQKPLSSLNSPVVPISIKQRRSVIVRAKDEEQLNQEASEASLLVDHDEEHTSVTTDKPSPVVRTSRDNIATIIDNNPYIFTIILIVALAVLRSASYSTITLDTDIAMLIVFAAFCVGLHIPSMKGVDSPTLVTKPTVTFKRLPLERSASRLLRMSMMASPQVSGESLDAMWGYHDDEEEVNPVITSPMDTFPEGAELGSHLNCWSEPEFTDFQVRGGAYLKDKKKCASGPFLFPVRGVDLFLTDSCPENVGSNSGVMGGKLRDVPTFIINFRLPWGVLLFYFEIPDNFLPFVKKAYDPDFDDSALPSLDSMTPGERTACRYLMGTDAQKNSTLKIVPVVVKGPWICKSVVGGKPAILGNKLPVNYVYQPREGDKAEYLEADLDIVASSAARGILSVVRSHTQGLTMDLGFVVQGNTEDELPEQMLVGVRLHGIDPLNAPSLPPMKNYLIEPTLSADGDESVTDGVP